MVRKKKNGEPAPSAPFWMTTYGDMITLVLCFFILLYSYSSLDALKWKQVVTSVKGSLGVMEGGKTLDDVELVGEGKPSSSMQTRKFSEDEIEQFEQLENETASLEELKNEIAKILNKEDNRIIVETDLRGIILRFQDSILFDKGKAYLKPEAKEVLTKVAEILQKVNQPIRIEGHTDDLAINTTQFPSNWELSTSRATNVLRFLLEFGINPKQLSAVGYGEYHPLVENIDEQTRRKNRRVDIVILKESISIQEPKATLGVANDG